jgi:hypothetical protein
MVFIEMKPILPLKWVVKLVDAPKGHLDIHKNLGLKYF